MVWTHSTTDTTETLTAGADYENIDATNANVAAKFGVVNCATCATGTATIVKVNAAYS